MLKNIFVFVTLLALSHGAVVKNLAVKNVEQKLSELLLKSSTQIANSPDRSMACFNKYLPQINNLTEQFQRSVNICTSLAEQRTNILISDMNVSRSQLTNNANETCVNYTRCNKDTTLEGFFSCYATVAKNAKKSSSEIETTSNRNIGHMKITLENINYDSISCRKESESIYEDACSETYAKLEECLAEGDK